LAADDRFQQRKWRGKRRFRTVARRPPEVPRAVFSNRRLSHATLGVGCVPYIHNIPHPICRVFTRKHFADAMLPGHVVGLHSEMFQELNAQRNVPGIKKCRAKSSGNKRKDHAQGRAAGPSPRTGRMRCTPRRCAVPCACADVKLQGQNVMQCYAAATQSHSRSGGRADASASHRSDFHITTRSVAKTGSGQQP
jgi:hypothetical protein